MGGTRPTKPPKHTAVPITPIMATRFRTDQLSQHVTYRR
jgi:hypothetical protein